MKFTIALAALLFGSVSVGNLLAQGQFRWGNNFTGVTRAPVYGVDPAAPGVPRTGNTANGLPMGTQVYGGPLLSGTGYTIAIYVGLTPSEVMINNSTPTTNGVGTFRTGAGAGITAANLLSEAPNIAGGTPNVAYQFRAWDNAGGTVTSWAQVMARGGTLAGGSSDIYVFGGPLGFQTITPPDTTQIRSFQLTMVPEPSLIALGALGLGALLLRRRK